MTALSSLLQLQLSLSQTQYRSAVQVSLDQDDAQQLIEAYIEKRGLCGTQVAWFGEKLASHSQSSIRYYEYNQGNQILGQEVELLVFDLSLGFDANSFSAATGALKGGGLVLLLNPQQLNSHYSKTWLLTHIEQWPVIHDLTLPLTFSPLTDIVSATAVNPAVPRFIQGKTEDQCQAIENIKKVLLGHRKRPLVMTAHRGRGKSACLGMATAELMIDKKRNIFITAPTVKAVKCVFEHAVKELHVKDQALMITQHSRYALTLSNGSSLQFIASDELILNKPECDLLLVDEAAALPLSILKKMTEHYHRMVFSSTVHGYEGCGRGFTLKFMQWLDENRKGWKRLLLRQPIRWHEGDPLERWLFDTFLLACELPCSANSITDIHLQRIEKTELLENTSLLQSVFGLLINAHYQTTPNDFFQLLDDDAMELYVVLTQSSMIGCILTNNEGKLSDNIIADIQQGKRRPKGHLVATHLSNHLSLVEPAKQVSVRIMRIAIHPDHQGQRIGQQSLIQLQEHLKGKVDFISTSFGATEELIHFWSRQFYLVKLGYHRDQASGCHSAMMVTPLSIDAHDWIASVHERFSQEFKFLLSNIFQHLEVSVVMAILSCQRNVSPQIEKSALIDHYCKGGNSFESVFFELSQFIWPLLCDEKNIKQGHEWKSIIAKVLQQQSWQQVSEAYHLSGRKAIEQHIKQVISAY